MLFQPEGKEMKSNQQMHQQKPCLKQKWNKYHYEAENLVLAFYLSPMVNKIIMNGR